MHALRSSLAASEMGLQQLPLEKEYEKNKDLRKQDVEHLKDWLEKQPHLPRISEFEIILFLHSCHYKPEATKNTIDTYFTVRTHCPEFFSNRQPNSELLKSADVGLDYCIATPTNDNFRVIYCKLLDLDPSKYNFNENLKIFAMMMDIWLVKEGTAPGHIIVFDMDGMVLGHVARLGLITMKKFMFYLQEAMPVRLKGLHFINVVPFMDKILAIMKPFMKKELLEVLHLHTDNLENFYKFVPKKCLPKDLGGESPSIRDMHEEMKKDLLESREFMAMEQKLRVDESRRPGKAKDASQLFGVEGSFKKLEID